jgi:broad specificity phosphatase PhoE
MTVVRDADRRRIFLMRHGSVSYFDAEGRPYPPDTVALSPLGREQATAAGALFRQARIRFDRVIVSGLARTVETAERVLAETGQAIALEPRRGLREIEGGRLGDIPLEQLREAFVGAFDGEGGMDTRFLGGETLGELMARVVPEIEAFRADPGWDVALLVLHGGVNRALLSFLLTGEKRFLGGLGQNAGCINALDLGAGKHDVHLRMLNHSPLDTLQTATRKTTMEILFDQYHAYRSRVKES